MARRASATVAATASPAGTSAPTSASVVSVPQDSRPAATKPLSLADRLKAKGGVAAAPSTTKSKGSVPVVKSPTPEIAAAIEAYIAASSDKDAAEGEMNAHGGIIRPVAEELRLAEARKAVPPIALKSISIDDKLTYSWPEISVGGIDNGPTPDQGKHHADWYKAGLREAFGELYDKYFNEKDTLILKDVVTQSQDLLDRLFRLLDGDPAGLKPEDKANNVAILFDQAPCVSCRKILDGANKGTCILMADATTDPKIEGLVKVAVSRGLLKVGSGRLAGKKAATAAAAAKASAPSTQVAIVVPGK